MIQIPNNWQPRDYQLDSWNYLEIGGERLVDVCHRRWGKDDISMHWAATQCVQKPATYWHMLPQASQARRAIWLSVNPHTGKRRIDEAFPESIRKRTNDNEMFIEFKSGAFWHVVGSDNYNSLVGSPPMGVVMSEWALANPAAWGYLDPILQENGGWAAFIYTPRGRNHGYKTFKHAQKTDYWHCELQTVEDTDVFTEQQLEAALETLVGIYGKADGESMFQQEYYCSFEAPILGAYYSHEIMAAEKDGRIGVFRHRDGLPVHTAWDLGHTDSTCIWFFQTIGSEIQIIDYYESNGHKMDHYVKEMQAKPYVYGTHLMPHDAFDSRYKLATGKTLAKSAEELGLKGIKEVDKTDIQHGINLARQMFGRCNFNEEPCVDGLETLRNYTQKWDDKNKTFTGPLHDWASHGADGFRTMATGMHLISSRAKPTVTHRTSRAKKRSNLSAIV